MTIRALTVIAAVAVLSGCSGEEKTEPPAVEVAAPVAPGRPAIYQAAGEGPEAFVRALYAVYATPAGMGEAPPPGQDPIYSRTLNAMIGADFNKAKGEVPHLNYDPICGCQDADGFALQSLAVAQSDPNAADASVALVNAGETKQQTLKLVREGTNWKVADVLVPGEAPLTEQLLTVIG